MGHRASKLKFNLMGSWTTAYRRPWVFLVVLGADNVLGYKIFSWTCCYTMHSSFATYFATHY